MWNYCLNDIQLCPVLIPYVCKLYSFIKLGISTLIQSNIPSSFGHFLESDMPLCLARCSQPVLLPMPMPLNVVEWSNLTELLKENFWLDLLELLENNLVMCS